MSNPFTKKNPLMSMWLSAANKVAGSARAQASAAAKREVSAAQIDIQKQMQAFWTGAVPKVTKRKRRR